MRAQPVCSFPSAVMALAAALLLVASAAATASHHGRGQQHRMPAFSDIDLDGDGAIVESEFHEARAARMAERAKAGGKMKHAGKAPTFQSIDLDEDGKISPDEFALHQAEMARKKHGKKHEKHDSKQSDQ